MRYIFYPVREGNSLTGLNPPRTINIYEECVSGVDFTKLKNFLKVHFGNIPLQISDGSGCFPNRHPERSEACLPTRQGSRSGSLKRSFGKNRLSLPACLPTGKTGQAGMTPREIKNFPSGQISETKDSIINTKGLLFDFPKTQKSFHKMFPKAKDSCDIILTDKIFATYGDDGRIHIRASIYGFPSVISTSGIIEAPAKPREFYLYKQKYSSLGVWDFKEKEVKKKFKGQFIDYDDKRLTEVVKGYIAQAIFFYATGEPFCENRSCRLFNAHWQKDLIYSQITSGKFCKKHSEMLEKLRNEGVCIIPCHCERPKGAKQSHF